MAHQEETLTRIRDDLYQVRLPLPFALRIVNVYLLRGAKGWTIVDTGIHTPDSEAVWRDVLSTLNIQSRDIEKIVLTHVHPDHFGLAGWLQSLGAEHDHHIPIYASPEEDAQVDIIWRNETSDFFGHWLINHGMPEDFAQTVAKSMGNTRAMTLPHPPHIQHLSAGDTLKMGERTWQMIHTPGHSDGHLMFYDAEDQLLISGDHVLMKITPNIGQWTHTATNPLGRFMASLSALQTMNVRLALPGHKWHITDWQGRIEELLMHHHERLDLVYEGVVRGNRTPYDITQTIFATDRFTPHEWRFAIAESLAHLEYLRLQDQLTKSPSQSSYEQAEIPKG